MKAYKGFNKDLTCRGFRFEEGKSFEESNASLCNNGFHACEVPLDTFNYYSPATSTYHEVEMDEVSDERHSDDSKIVSKKITIGAKLDIAGICKAQFEYVKSHTTTEFIDPERATAGNYGAATAGYKGAATAGNYGAATAGENGAATAGYKGAATAGNYGAATAGENGAATAGYKGAATAGYKGAATAGENGAATAGENGAATSRGSVDVGENGIASVRGNNVKVKGGLGALLVIGIEETNSYDLKEYKVMVVDGEIIKADTWYTLNNGEIEEIKC